jgi:phytoene synthase
MTPLPPTPPAIVFAWSATRFGAAPAALFALDAQFGEIVRTTRTPAVGQMRLTWWYDALRALDDREAPAQPVLRALAEAVLPTGVTGTQLAEMVDGWEPLLEEEAPDDAALTLHAEARGGILSAAVLRTLSVEPSPGDRAAGACWALADLAAHVGAPDLARRAAEAAAARRVVGASRLGRALGRDAVLAATGQGAPGSPRRAVGVLRAMLRR